MSLVLLALAIWLVLWWLNEHLVNTDFGYNPFLQKTVNAVVPLIFGITIFIMSGLTFNKRF